MGVILTTYVGPGMILQVMACIYHVTNVQNPYDIPLYWLVFRDPQNGLLYSLCNWVVYPLYTLNSQGVFIANVYMAWRYYYTYL